MGCENSVQWARSYLVNAGRFGKAHLVGLEHYGGRIARCNRRVYLAKHNLSEEQLARCKARSQVCKQCTVILANDLAQKRKE